MFRIRYTLPSGQRLAYTGLYAHGCEAVQQTLADHPDARSVSALFIRRTA